MERPPPRLAPQLLHDSKAALVTGTSTAIIVSGRMGSRATGDQPPKSSTAVPPRVTPVVASTELAASRRIDALAKRRPTSMRTCAGRDRSLLMRQTRRE